MTEDQQEVAVMVLRIELYAAAQRLTGKHKADLRSLVDEIQAVLAINSTPAPSFATEVTP